MAKEKYTGDLIAGEFYLFLGGSVLEYVCQPNTMSNIHCMRFNGVVIELNEDCLRRSIVSKHTPTIKITEKNIDIMMPYDGIIRIGDNFELWDGADVIVNKIWGVDSKNSLTIECLCNGVLLMLSEDCLRKKIKHSIDYEKPYEGEITEGGYYQTKCSKKLRIIQFPVPVELANFPFPKAKVSIDGRMDVSFWTENSLRKIILCKNIDDLGWSVPPPPPPPTKPHSHDNVNNPKHYALKSGRETIDIIGEILPPEQFIGFLRGNIFKYDIRYREKGGIEDLKKAEWYKKKLIEAENEHRTTTIL